MSPGLIVEEMLVGTLLVRKLPSRPWGREGRRSQSSPATSRRSPVGGGCVNETQELKDYFLWLYGYFLMYVIFLCA